LGGGCGGGGGLGRVVCKILRKIERRKREIIGKQMPESAQIGEKGWKIPRSELNHGRNAGAG